MTSEQKQLNSAIIKNFANAPESQLSERLRKLCEEWDGSDEQMHYILCSIYYGCCESSSFCKAVVNPKYTGFNIEQNKGITLHNHKF